MITLEDIFQAEEVAVFFLFVWILLVVAWCLSLWWTGIREPAPPKRSDLLISLGDALRNKEDLKAARYSRLIDELDEK